MKVQRITLSLLVHWKQRKETEIYVIFLESVAFILPDRYQRTGIFLLLVKGHEYANKQS